MTYTEIKTRNENEYFYRVISIRDGNKVKKKRIYLGSNLDKNTLSKKELKADELFLKERIRNNIIRIKPQIIRILTKYKVKRASLFGSYTRGGQKKDSDIDILIEPPKGIGLKFVGIALDLERALNKKVDLLTYNGINPHIKKYIMKDEIKIL